ncbi:LysR family transcriptional regulator [Nocardiopsis trehalosi]|uniref:LysR family transcriptional regulator n=1 Tax=Nocardiopsis trehalosi TaxID=109329 RepID=UPI001FE20BE2|nr:LysR family transcriptional regulator [Nocardiopsis trehalosi]
MQGGDVDARRLAYFLAIVDHGGFGRAAERLHIAQPSLSQAIAALERDLGADLFHRAGRGVALTDVGAQLVEPARRVIRDLDAVRDTARAARGLRRGRVDVVSMPSPGIEPLTTLMAAFARAHPAMSVHVAAAFTADEVVRAVRSGAAEVGLLGSAVLPRAAGLDVLAVEDQPLVLLSPPGRAPDTGPVPRADLGGLRLVASPPGSLVRGIVDDALAGGAAAHLAAEVAHRTSILPLVLAGVGHAVVPAAWRPLAARAGVVVRPITPAPVLRVSAVSRAGRLTPGARAFLDAAERYAAERAAAGDGGADPTP